jgi:hypothetical protein
VTPKKGLVAVVASGRRARRLMRSAMIETRQARPISVRMPCAVAACIAVVAGLLMTLMGGGHAWGVLAQSEPSDPTFARMAALVATGVVVALPGLLALALSRALWKGRRWAYAVCLITALSLMAYLFYLLAYVAPNSTTVGSELDMATIVVGVYAVSLVGGLRASCAKTGKTTPPTDI